MSQKDKKKKTLWTSIIVLSALIYAFTINIWVYKYYFSAIGVVRFYLAHFWGKKQNYIQKILTILNIKSYNEFVKSNEFKLGLCKNKISLKYLNTWNHIMNIQWLLLFSTAILWNIKKRNFGKHALWKWSCRQISVLSTWVAPSFCLNLKIRENECTVLKSEAID